MMVAACTKIVLPACMVALSVWAYSGGSVGFPRRLLLVIHYLTPLRVDKNWRETTKLSIFSVKPMED
jgi:hypothetical protein